MLGTPGGGALVLPLTTLSGLTLAQGGFSWARGGVQQLKLRLGVSRDANPSVDGLQHELVVQLTNVPAGALGTVTLSGQAPQTFLPAGGAAVEEHVPLTLLDGAHTVVVRVEDSCGNRTESAAIDVLVDTSPSALLITAYEGGGYGARQVVDDGGSTWAATLDVDVVVGTASTDRSVEVRVTDAFAIDSTGRTCTGTQTHLTSSPVLAAELGADVTVARTGALLHDIGKAVDHEVQGTHVEIGRRILEKFGVDKKVIQAMQSHHEEYPYETPEAIIVQVADAISGGRPGARRDTVDRYLERLGDLERLAATFEGVEKVYAIAAGREIRVFVNPGKISDIAMHTLARDIAKRIQEELKYPGEIKVNIIRENRVIEFAR